MSEKDSKEKAVKAKAAAPRQRRETVQAKTAGPSLAVSDGREVAHPVPRLKSRYAQEVVPAFMTRHGFKNGFQVPRLVKIVVNVGVSDARDNIQVLDGIREELALITGQLPQIRRAKKSISNFKLREGMPIGLRVTLHGDRMYEFLDRLISTSIPRLRDFRGLEPRGFDGTGNYNLGLREQMIFPEINVEKSITQHGLNITFVTTAGADGLSLELLRDLGMPFKAVKAAESPSVGRE